MAHVIDPNGVLPSGEHFSGFSKCVITLPNTNRRSHGTRILIAYGLGRPYGFTDRDLLTTFLEAGSKQNQISIRARSDSIRSVQNEMNPD